MKIHLYDKGVRRTYCGILFIATLDGKFWTKRKRKAILIKSSHFVGDCTCEACFKVWIK